MKLAKSSGFRWASGSYDGLCKYSRKIPNWLTSLRKVSRTCKITFFMRVGGVEEMGVGGTGGSSRNLRGLRVFRMTRPDEEKVGGVGGRGSCTEGRGSGTGGRGSGFRRSGLAIESVSAKLGCSTLSNCNRTWSIVFSLC